MMRDRKWIKKALLFEPQASFNAFPFFVMHNWAPEGRWLCGRLLLLTFLGGARKVSGCRAAPGLQTVDQTKQINRRKKVNLKLKIASLTQPPNGAGFTRPTILIYQNSETEG